MSSWRIVRLSAALWLTLATWCLATPTATDPLGGSRPTTPLCELLESISQGEQRPATVRGILVLGFETTMLYDPDSPSCPLDVQPFTAVKMPGDVPGADRLAANAKQSDGRAYVILRGVLWGPGKVKADDLSPSLIVSYSRRAPARYGHMGYSRTQFVVEEVLASAPVPPTVPSMGETGPRAASAIPVLLEAAVPTYPGFALNMKITGEVIVEVTVKGGRATSTTVKAGDRALAVAVLKNIETWRFDEKVEATFTTKFEFALELRKTGADRNTKLELNLPSSAKIIAAEHDW